MPPEASTPLHALIDSVLQQLPAHRGNDAAILAALNRAGVLTVSDLVIMLEHDYQELKDALKGIAPAMVLVTIKIVAIRQQQSFHTLQGRAVLCNRKVAGAWSILSNSGLPNPDQPNLLDKISERIYQNNQLAMFILLILSTIKSAEYGDSLADGDSFISVSMDTAVRVEKSLRTGTFASAFGMLLSNLLLRDIFVVCSNDEDAKHILENSPKWALCLPTYALKLSFILVAVLWTWVQVLKVEWKVFLCNQLLQWFVLLALPWIMAKALNPANVIANRQKVQVAPRL